MCRLVALPAWSGCGKVDNWADPRMSQAYFECACGSMMGTPVGVVTGRLEGWVGALVGHETAATSGCIGIGGSDGSGGEMEPKKQPHGPTLV